jgi:diaminopimelate decarboxylase
MSKSLFNYKQNQLYFNSVNVTKIERVQNYQKPFLLYQRHLIQQRIDWIKSWNKLHRLHFAMKSNDNVDVLKLILKNNCGLDVVSLGEIEKAKACGFKAQDLIFSGVGKTKFELSKAIECDIYQINVESVSELRRINEISKAQNKKVNIGLRINPEVDAKTHPNIATALRDSKFGLALTDLDQCFSLIDSNPKLIFKAISYHLGSQIMSSAPFLDALKKVKPLFLKLQSKYKTLDRLDLGGGLGIDYKDHDLEKDEIQWRNLKTVYESELSDLKAEFLIEMGRFVVARSAVLISEVQYIKKTENTEIIILDVGMNNLMRPSLYQAYHHILPFEKRDTIKKYMIVGPICESTDFFHKEIQTTEIHEGDMILFCDAGAYVRSMASNYNLQPIVEEYFLD